jgi:hypothetical protein
MAFYDDRAAMEREVAALVPAGTSLPEAKKTMRANGFTCLESRDPKPATDDVPREPYLLCQYDQMTGIFGNYHVSVKFACTEDGQVGEGTIAKLTATRGLAKELPVSDSPQPVEPAPLWTKVVLGTGITALCVVALPLAIMAFPYGR